MLPPALRHSSQPHALIPSQRSRIATRASRLKPASCTLQTRTYFGRRHRDDQHRHADMKRVRNYNYKEDSDPTVDIYGRKIEDSPAGQSPPDPISSPKSNNKEEIWQQRMDHIRKALEKDPYEALFGNSNRLLGRFGKRDWPLDLTNFWRNQADRESTWKKQMSSWRIDVLGDEDSSQQTTSRTKSINSAAPTIASRTESSNKPAPATASPARVDSHGNDDRIEYDPISNRMIRKSETGFSHYGQDLDAAVDTPVKQFEMAEPANESPVKTSTPRPVVQKQTSILQTSLERYTTSPKTEKQNDGKPMQTSLDRYVKESSKAPQPSFTMLKEDPVTGQPPSPPAEVARSKATESVPTDLRAEYDQYKAARLPPAKFARDDWLIQEGFMKPASSKPSDLSQGKDTKKRLKLEDEFNEMHSIEKAPVENLSDKLWEAQKNKGAEPSAEEQDSTRTMSRWLGDEWTMEKLRQQEFDALSPKAPDATTAGEAVQECPDPASHHVKLATQTAVTKAGNLDAMEGTTNYDVQVAKDNMSNEEVNAKREMDNKRRKVAESAAHISDHDFDKLNEKSGFILQTLEEKACSETIEPSTRHVKLEQESANTEAQEAIAMNEIMEYNRAVAKQNRENKEADAKKEMACAETITPSTQHVKLEQDSASTKAQEAIAMNEIMEYNRTVAKKNIENKEADAKKEMAENRARAAAAIAKARADVDVMRYQRQVARDNLKNKVAEIQKETVDYRALIAEAIEEARAHAEDLDLNLSKIGQRLRVSHIRSLRDAKEKIQVLIQKMEETRKAGYEAQSVQQHAADLKEIQGAGAELAKLAGEFKANLATDGSPIDESVLAKEDVVHQSAPTQLLRRIPSLAEFFGYRPKRDANAALAKPVKDFKLAKAQSSLEKEIAEQKAAMEALETPRVPAVSSTANSPSASAWPVSDRIEPPKQIDENDSLTRRIRSIYESKHGKISSSHVQPMVDSCNPNLIIAPPVEPEAAAPAPTNTREVTTSTDSVPAAVDAPETLPAAVPNTSSVAEVPEPVTAPAATEAEPLLDTPAAPYTLLAYDEQTQSITRASFTSPPQSSETTIPLTLALKDLHHPAKFLPLVQELRLKGYEPVHGERNMLILRQMQGHKSGVSEAFVVDTVGAKDEPRPQLPSWGATSGPRRTEEVFSGGQMQRGTRKEKKNRKKAWRRAIRRLAVGVAAAGGTIYVAGVMAEMTKVVVS